MNSDFSNILYFSIYLLVSTVLSIFVKLWAFKRIGSYSIDVVIFSLLYCIFNCLTDSVNHTIWLYKSIVDLLFLLILSYLHSNSYDDLRKKITDDLRNLKNQLPDTEDKKKIESLTDIVFLATEVAYTKLKPGKLERRKQIRQLFKDLELDPNNILDNELDDTFMLKPSKYKYYLSLFIAITIVTLIITNLPNSQLSFLNTLFSK